MTTFQPTNPDYAQCVRDSFARQGAMSHIGAVLKDVLPGRVEIRLPYSEGVSQQHGFFHGGILGAVADSAAGYAGFSLMAAGDGVLTVEYKLNLMAPAQGEWLIARGVVVRPGRTLTVTRAEVFVARGEAEVHCASMQQTLMRIVGRSGITG